MALLRHTHYLRTLQLLPFALIIWKLIEAASIHSAPQAREDIRRESCSKEKVFIASIHWNSEHILRSHWMPALLALVQELDSEHVYVSLQEIGSWDGSKDARRRMQAGLERRGIRHTIVLDPTTHLDEVNRPLAETGWVWTPRESIELSRIPYLSRSRNLVMQPMRDLQASDGETFDRVLFLNDVVFTTQDVSALMTTQGGEYAAACSLDFATPPRFYTSNLTFRGIPDILAARHLEGSECCLIHADNPLAREKGVWVNPRVRVGYSEAAYRAVNPGGAWLSILAIWRGIWENRVRRWCTTNWSKSRIVHRRVADWEREDASRREDGTVCLINEMQVLVHNGWTHV